VTYRQGFVTGLRNHRSSRTIIPPDRINSFLDIVIKPYINIQSAHDHFLKSLETRPHERGGVDHIGVICLGGAAEFVGVYPEYASCLPGIEATLMDEVEKNEAFREFMKVWLTGLSSLR
jgi:hypothetical protein